MFDLNKEAEDEMKKKTQIILLVIFAVLLIIRLALPAVALRELNKILADFSPAYQFHITDLDLSIIRGAYRFEGFKGTIPKREEPFLYAESVDISIAWRDLFKGKVTTDIVADGVRFVLTDDFLNAVKSAPEKPQDDAKDLGNTLFPLKVSRIDLKNSEIKIGSIANLPEALQLRISQIEGRMSNVTPDPTNPLSIVTLKGTALDKSDIKGFGQLNLTREDKPWYVAVEMYQFPITQLNPWLKSLVPFTFLSGKGDVFAEVKSEHGEIEGYGKPLVKGLAFVGNSDDFKSFKQFGIEITGAAANLLLRRADDRTVATRIEFSYRQGKFDWDLGKAISESIQHGFGESIKPGIENRYELTTEEKGK